MTLKDQVKIGMMACLTASMPCPNCPYNQNKNGEIRSGRECREELWNDFNLLISDMENAIKLLEEES